MAVRRGTAAYNALAPLCRESFPAWRLTSLLNKRHQRVSHFQPVTSRRPSLKTFPLQRANKESTPQNVLDASPISTLLTPAVSTFPSSLTALSPPSLPGRHNSAPESQVSVVSAEFRMVTTLSKHGYM